MKKKLLKTIVLCAAGLALGAQAQTSPDTSGTSGSSSSQSGWLGRSSPTGRMGHQEIRLSQLTGAAITSTSGTQLGTISDAIVNPASGRLEFAILSLNSSATEGAAGTQSSGGSSTAASGSSTTGKEVAVPWMLLHPAAMGGTSGAATPGQQSSFVFSGDGSKLAAAPTFDPNTDLTQPGWRQSVFSYFGLGRGAGAAGGAEIPGGAGTSSGASGGSPGGSSSSGGQ